MMAMVQVRRPSAGQAYYQRKLAEGKSPKEALRCLKRRLSDAIYRCLLADQHLQPTLDGPTPGDAAGRAVQAHVSASGPAPNGPPVVAGARPRPSLQPTQATVGIIYDLTVAPLSSGEATADSLTYSDGARGWHRAAGAGSSS